MSLKRERPAVRWVEASSRPPVEEDYGAFTRSVDVLLTDGKRVWLGHLQVWEEDEYEPQWKMDGPDGYELEGVTHWSFLPALPESEGVVT